MVNVKVGQKYRHTKRGNLYKIIGFALDSNTLEEVVIYQGLYDSKEFGKNPIWARPLKEFIEDVEIDGKKVKRFELIG